jgi:2-keto-4-pentenoate hydratase
MFKNFNMKKIFISIIALLIFFSCTKEESSDKISEASNISTSKVVDSLLQARHQAEQTNILSRKLPEISREQAIAIQLATLGKELDSGAQLVGWKMGGTITDDSASYDPMFGYILDSNVIEQDSVLSASNFPGNQTMVEGEIGFVMARDFKNGAKSLEELKSGIDHIVNAIEFAQDIAIPVNGDPSTKNINHVLASGLGQAGFILGSGNAAVRDFDMKNETVKCFINDSLAAEGVSSNVYGGPLEALYSLANLLPEYDRYLKKGDVVITGSLYENPTIDSRANVEVAFGTLGTINFSMK